jgi:energy-coupling factor transport system ATP-binding protein
MKGLYMEIIRTEQLDFTYSGANEKALDNINFCIESGEIVTLCGASGCGKSTLLRNLKKVIAPFGTKKGNIFYKGTLLENVQEDIQVREIGFVSQSADNQIVTDRVYHELSFGLESLGYDNDIIRRRVGEIATFFGITDWFYKDVNELSGGQKQILCLASIMTMLPQVIILDEPTSQLDTIAAGEFVNMLLKINRELGITIIITEHRLDEILPYSDRVIVMDKGKIVANDTPDKVCLELREMKHRMFLSMPVPVRIWNGCNNSGNKCPLTINEGRKWLENYVREQDICIVNDKTDRELNKVQYNEYALRARELWFKYDKNGKDILKGVNLNVKLGEIYGILGGNGAGKSTLLSLLCGNRSAYRGKIKCEGRVCMLPQDPKSLFVKKTVRDELEEVVEIKKSHGSNASKNVERCEKEFDECELGNIIKVCRLNELLERNPYDLSGGEQQRVALAKIMLTNPEIILLDEPTKGLDNEYKLELGKMLREMTMRGKTIIMVSHDIEFCGEWTDRCGLFFDGNIISEAGHREFFSNNSFYTTATNRMARNVIDNAIVPSDIVDIYAKSACLKTKQCIENYEKNDDIENYEKNDKQENIEEKKENANYRQDNIRKEKDNINYKKENELDDNNILKSRIDKRFLITAIMIIVAIPFTIYAGIYCFEKIFVYIFACIIGMYSTIFCYL